jgi:putative FmdB family regulatory protein
MPTYQYVCRDCEHRFEAVQSIHDANLTECPECGGPIRRVLSPVGVTFKGSGFYRTDSREGKKSAASKTAGAGAPSGASDTSGAAAKESGGGTGGSDSSAASGGSKDSGGGSTPSGAGSGGSGNSGSSSGGGGNTSG